MRLPYFYGSTLAARLIRASGGDDLAGRGTAIDAQRVYDGLAAEQQADGDVTIGRALSNDVLKVNNKIFAFTNGGRLVVKLPADRCVALVASGAAAPFTSGGRTMKEWVAVALPGSRAKKVWGDLVADAKTYVGGR
ncbi:MAG: hypothetical protein QOG49_426 [Frankiaceae bacterium]|jgi:hypothetical protein|nr:hypothetical protein [Frankiaceae bacterium]